MNRPLAASILFGLLSAAPALADTPAAAPQTFTLTLTVEGVRAAEGNIMAQLMKADYTAGKAANLEGKQVPAAEGVTTITFTGLEAGDYAVQLFHDQDGDGEMKTNAFGIPKEGFAFSNRAKAKFGPPDFKDMKVAVTADTATAAVLSY